jgi:hypothetical protein
MVKSEGNIFSVGDIYARFIQLEFILNECRGIMVNRRLLKSRRRHRANFGVRVNLALSARP